MSTENKTKNKTKFWVVCCEDTEATRQITKAVADWQLLGVRSLITSELADAKAIAQSEYAIFITMDSQPCAQIKISPLSLAQTPVSAATHSAAPTPASQLIVMHERCGQSPQSWWFKLPTSEIRAQKVQPITTDKSVAQALSQIEVFVRNYTRAFSATMSYASASASTEPTNTAESSNTASAKHEMAEDKRQATKPQPAKRKVVLSHYRRV